MKNRISAFCAIIAILLLPVIFTYLFFTSTFLEDSTAKVFTFFGQPTITKADQAKILKLTKEAQELRKRVEKTRPRVKDLLLRDWAEKNGKIRHLVYVKKRFGGRIKIAAKKYNVKREIIAAVIATEWHPVQNTSCKGAVGPMQLMAETADELKVNRHHEFENILGGTKYLKNLLEKYDGNLVYALAAYNAGPGKVSKYGGIPPYKETKNYVKRVKYLFTHQIGKNA